MRIPLLITISRRLDGSNGVAMGRIGILALLALPTASEPPRRSNYCKSLVEPCVSTTEQQMKTDFVNCSASGRVDSPTGPDAFLASALSIDCSTCGLLTCNQGTRWAASSLSHRHSLVGNNTRKVGMLLVGLHLTSRLGQSCQDISILGVRLSEKNVAIGVNESHCGCKVVRAAR